VDTKIDLNVSFVLFLVYYINQCYATFVFHLNYLSDEINDERNVLILYLFITA